MYQQRIGIEIIIIKPVDRTAYRACALEGRIICTLGFEYLRWRTSFMCHCLIFGMWSNGRRISCLNGRSSWRVHSFLNLFSLIFLDFWGSRCVFLVTLVRQWEGWCLVVSNVGPEFSKYKTWFTGNLLITHCLTMVLVTGKISTKTRSLYWFFSPISKYYFS